MDLANPVLSTPCLSRYGARALFETPDIGMLYLDEGGHIVDANAVFCEMLQYSRQALKGQRLSALADPQPPTDHDQLETLHDLGHLRSTDLPLISRDGLRLRCRFRRVGVVLGQAELIECGFEEVESSAQRPAPPLALPRGDAIEALAELAIEHTRAQGPPLSLLSIGIDGLTDVPGLWTQPLPAALRGFAQTCASFLRPTDIVGWVSGRALVALLPGVAAKGARSAAERLRTAVATLSGPTAEGNAPRITLSIGIVATRTGRTSYRALRSRADAKRDDALHSGGNRICV